MKSFRATLLRPSCRVGVGHWHVPDGETSGLTRMYEDESTRALEIPLQVAQLRTQWATPIISEKLQWTL